MVVHYNPLLADSAEYKLITTEKPIEGKKHGCIQ
jgi:hypothetical protein